MERGVPKPQLLVSDRCQVVMPYHKELDGMEEARLAAKSFGSTKSGIAPFYSDKYAKIGFQISDLFDDKDSLMDRIDHVLGLKNVLYTELYHQKPLDRDEIYEKLMEYKEALTPYVADTTTLLHNAVKEGKTILLEGQLGSLKDPDLGIYPMVTSSSPLAGYGAVGAGGIPPYAIQEIVTVVKAYSSAVGAGEFVSEIFGEEADELRRRGGDGGEYGATTGRPRRMGWLDLVAARYGCMVQGATAVAFTVLDALGYLDEIPVCVGYELDGKRIRLFPAHGPVEALQTHSGSAARLEVRHRRHQEVRGPARKRPEVCGVCGASYRCAHHHGFQWAFPGRHHLPVRGCASLWEKPHNYPASVLR